MTARFPSAIQPIDATLTHVVLPPREATSARPPALLLLHGRGADERDLVGFAAALDPRLLVISARAPGPLGPGFHWYELGSAGLPDAASFTRSRDLLDRFLDEIVAGYNIDPTRLFLLGFSQGAVMSGAMLLTRPAKVAGAVLLSGYLPLRSELTTDETGLRGKPVFVGHGVRDAVISVHFGREADSYLRGAGAVPTYREYPVAHQIDDVELRDIADWLVARLDAPVPSEANTATV